MSYDYPRGWGDGRHSFFKKGRCVSTRRWRGRHDNTQRKEGNIITQDGGTELERGATDIQEGGATIIQEGASQFSQELVIQEGATWAYENG